MDAIRHSLKGVFIVIHDPGEISFACLGVMNSRSGTQIVCFELVDLVYRESNQLEQMEYGVEAGIHILWVYLCVVFPASMASSIGLILWVHPIPKVSAAVEKHSGPGAIKSHDVLASRVQN